MRGVQRYPKSKQALNPGPDAFTARLAFHDVSETGFEWKMHVPAARSYPGGRPRARNEGDGAFFGSLCFVLGSLCFDEKTVLSRNKAQRTILQKASPDLPS